MDKPVEVLVIDDEAIVCERLTEFLTGKGLYVEAFTESQKAIARMEKRTFDVVVTDLKMSERTVRHRRAAVHPGNAALHAGNPGHGIRPV